MSGVVSPLDAVRRYHDDTKHDFHRFAQSLGYLDWASQPDPFRSFAGSRLVPLYPHPAARHDAYAPTPVAYDDLFHDRTPSPLSASLLGDVLRHSLGLSAWKQFRDSRWSLRVNPSSGNLHPTEAYAIVGPIEGVSDRPTVFHYAADRHALEQRCAFGEAAWVGSDGAWLIALTSIHWREAWKYGERAFRYCQHDLGHAIAALRFACALVGWRAVVLPAWSHHDIAALAGVDRDVDYVEAEREEPACVLAITRGDVPERFAADRGALVAAVAGGEWTGRASQLSTDHVQWTFIDEVARATADPGAGSVRHGFTSAPQAGCREPGRPASDLDARTIMLRRRSAVALDGRFSIDAGAFVAMLSRALPGAHAPWDALWWPPHVHLVLFVHRVDGVPPGLYALVREDVSRERLGATCSRDFAWERASPDLPLYRLAGGDCRSMAARLSCDQEIAADGFFSAGMLVDFDRGLATYGAPFYRRLFWECGALGQVLYLEAEAAGARGTGIGCFYDDAVHRVLGIGDHSFQSFYHFTVGIPVEDARLQTTGGYAWER